MINLPFPPSINVEEIIQIHLKNGTKIIQIMNEFMIYRKEYSNAFAKNLSNLLSQHLHGKISLSMLTLL